MTILWRGGGSKQKPDALQKIRLVRASGNPASPRMHRRQFLTCIWQGRGKQAVWKADLLVCDLFQSLERSRVQLHGKLPTITPGSHLAVKSIGPAILLHEKLLLHAFPLRLMKVPLGVSGRDLEAMGGGTIHVKVVALARRYL